LLKAKNIFFVGGGTAGHIFPNLALYQELQTRQKNSDSTRQEPMHESRLHKSAFFNTPNLLLEPWVFHYIGGHQPCLEQQILQQPEFANIQFHSIYTGKLRRYIHWKTMVEPWFILLGFIQCLFLFFKYRPVLLFSKGGYVSAPAVWAAWLCHIPVCIHESDASWSLTAKITRPFASHIFTAFPLTYKPSVPLLHWGIPLRPSLYAGDKQLFTNTLSVTDQNRLLAGMPLLLIAGGSLGSKWLETQTAILLQNGLAEHFVVVYLGGTQTGAELKKLGAYVIEFNQNLLSHILAATDMVLTRGGATFLYEFASLCKPMLIVPLSKAASRGDQIHNAHYFTNNDWALSIEQEVWETVKVLKLLNSLKEKQDYFKRNLALQTWDATKSIADLLQQQYL
jgi:UDP-N-acetylglucosamine--N-acetylmuramyl-(pentapeptide) pyrophosphoryl-undecaprenol N-acetylglucosamine transferase